MPKGMSTRGTERPHKEGEENAPGSASGISELAERPLTASVFRDMMDRVSENLLRHQMELQSQQQRFLQQMLNQMASQRVE